LDKGNVGVGWKLTVLPYIQVRQIEIRAAEHLWERSELIPAELDPRDRASSLGQCVFAVGRQRRVVALDLKIIILVEYQAKSDVEAFLVQSGVLRL